MEFNPLHNFISPVTGRVLSDPDYVLVGNKKGIAIPSPILIDIRLDLQKVQNEIDKLTPFSSDISFIIKTPDSRVPNAQAMSILADGFMFNNAGTISTTNDIPLPNLTDGMFWLGNSSNRPVATKTINLDNLPSLGVTVVPTPTGGFVGKVWEGTSSGRPEESSIVGEMFADIGILNAKFSAGHFVMHSGLSASFPKAQFLNALTAGALIKTSSAGDGKLESLVLTQDQILMGGANNAPESRARLGVENLPLLTEGKLWKGTANSIPQSITTIDVSNLPNLNNGKIWQGDAGNRPTEVTLNFAPHDATYILKQPNQTLTNAQVLSELGTGMAKIIIGGAFAIAVPDEDYATQATLEQIKAETEEFKNQAATSAEEASTSATEASASATEASASATEATAAATEATGAAAEATAAATVATGAAVEATTAATVATGAVVEATTAAGAAGISAAAAALSALSAGSSSSSASSSASDASSSASNAHDSAVNSSGSASQSLQYLNQLLNTGITLTGEAYGAGKLSEPIHTKVGFSFFSKVNIPLNPHLGMLLFVEK
jgi:hypothetical protein